MMDLKGYEGFCLTIDDHSPEANNIKIYCMIKDIPIIRVKESEKCPSNYIPSGSVEWVLHSLGKNIVPDYYPDWCKHLLYRNVWKGDKWLQKRVFVMTLKMKDIDNIKKEGIKMKKKESLKFLNKCLKEISEMSQEEFDARIEKIEKEKGTHYMKNKAYDLIVKFEEKELTIDTIYAKDFNEAKELFTNRYMGKFVVREKSNKEVEVVLV